MRVRTHNDLTQWLKFFLTGIIETAEAGVKTFDGILQLQKSMDEKIKVLGIRSRDARKLIEFLYDNSIIDASVVSKVIEKTPASAYKLIASLEDLEIISEITGSQRGRLYLFNNYMDLFSADS